MIARAEEARTRAKYLSRGGVHEVSHAVESGAANDVLPLDPAQESAPGLPSSGRLRSAVQTVGRAEMAAAFHVAAAGMSDADMGAVLDEPAQRVQRMRTGELPIRAEHLLLLARRRVDVFEHLVREMRGR